MCVNPSVYAYNVSDTFLPHLLICYGHVWDYLDNPGDDAVSANARSGGTRLRERPAPVIGLVRKITARNNRIKTPATAKW